MIFHILIDIIIGIAAGFIAGLLGTGNSLVVLPALIFIFTSTFSPEVALPLAVGTNLAICGVSILTVGSSLIAGICFKNLYFSFYFPGSIQLAFERTIL